MSTPLIALAATLKSLLSAARPKHIYLALTTAGRDLLPLSVELRPHTCLSVRTHRSQLPEPPFGGGDPLTGASGSYSSHSPRSAFEYGALERLQYCHKVHLRGKPAAAPHPPEAMQHPIHPGVQGRVRVLWAAVRAMCACLHFYISQQ